jgi:protein SCO1/2
MMYTCNNKPGSWKSGLLSLKLVCGVGLALSAVVPATAQVGQPAELNSIGIDQKLGAQVPRDLKFLDEHGKHVTLGDYMNDKPIILNMIFYNCRGTCTLELNGMVSMLDHMKQMTAGKEFRVVTVSIHPKETPVLAMDKKRSYMELYRPEAEAGWSFLTGQDDQIKALAAAVGFRYTYDPVKDRIAHPACIMFLTPEGKVAQYLFGVKYPEKAVVAAIKDAGALKVAKAEPTPVLIGCFMYDPKTGKYTAQIMTILKYLGIASVAGMALMITMLSVKGPRGGSAAKTI